MPDGGYYEVHANWTSDENRASNVPIDIQHSDGTSTVVVNQRSGGSRWNLLGTFEFQAGSPGAVVVHNDGADGYVIADAVRFVQQQASGSAASATESPDRAPVAVGGEGDEDSLASGLVPDSTTGPWDRDRGEDASGESIQALAGTLATPRRHALSPVHRETVGATDLTASQ